MVTTSVSFSKQGNSFVSDAIMCESNMIAVQIKYDKSGGTVLERSVDGTDWYRIKEPLLSYGSKGIPVFETNISGLVTGQKLRFVFSPDVIPTSIKLLK